MKKYIINLCVLGMSLQGLFAENLSTNKEIPATSSIGPMTVANLNLNRQGNTIVARGGEKIFSTLNFSCDTTSSDPHTLYQLVIGYDSGPQRCILNELGYRVEGKEGILSFFCEAPEEPGTYEILCNVSSARSPAEALQSWWDQKEGELTTKAAIGRIVVK